MSKDFRTRIVLLPFLLLIASVTHNATDSRFKVQRAVDGDTLQVLQGAQKIKLRLAGIDSPERGQPYYSAAREYICSMVCAQHIDVVPKGRDRYGRLLGIVFVHGREINLAMVKAGYAWSWPIRKRYGEAEAKARADRKGLFHEKHPTPPWEFRAARNKIKRKPSISGRGRR